eukprot:CAMPEP_0185772476 /NCGR_PEP_ID=MMETSP1174-20130828/69246_1 /TAXON_ID=35687 /ORGANISM="Dictyocha speculum, Strain CCMP1381" /LENGTH=558 /DNA_ID=CAMNT_0028458777 /DNA_START=13 /DNA_END=1689 /DNA_ORIENTATION=+
MAKIKKTALGVGNSSSNPNRKLSAAKVNGGSARTANKIKIINMYKKKEIRNKEGKIIGGDYCTRDRAGGAEITAATGRIAPDRRWFGNTRTVGQAELDTFREEMTVKSSDPYSVILRRKKLPMGLLMDSTQGPVDGGKTQLLEVESFDDTFNGRRARKRPKLDASNLDALMAKAGTQAERYEGIDDRNKSMPAESLREGRRADLFMKGQSKRIWAELYKVLDCSDVVLHILDARNVPGTRCTHMEKYLKKHAAHKHLIFVMNKCDLVPTWVTKKWLHILSRDAPTLAFHATMGSSFGKGALINLLRQFSKLHADKKAISVGIVGYPNVGKSSIINTLRAKKVCKTAPVPGETKIWQYVSLMKRISLIDCPGIVYDTGDNETDIVLKGIVRAERLPDPYDYIPALLERVKTEHVKRTYGLESWTDATDLMTQIAKKNGRLLGGGEPDFHTVAVNIINDWQRGKLPYYVAPPEDDDRVAAIKKAAKEKTSDVSGQPVDETGGDDVGSSEEDVEEVGNEDRQEGTDQSDEEDAGTREPEERSQVPTALPVVASVDAEWDDL